MKTKIDRIAFGASGACGVASGVGFFIVADDGRLDPFLSIMCIVVATTLIIMRASHLQWAVKK